MKIHEVVYWNDPDFIFAPNGAIEALQKAKEQGKVRFVGFRGHKDPRIHLKMLSHNFPFDTVQMPLNCFDASFRSFEQNILPELNRRGIGRLWALQSQGPYAFATNFYHLLFDRRPLPVKFRQCCDAMGARFYRGALSLCAFATIPSRACRVPTS